MDEVVGSTLFHHLDSRYFAFPEIKALASPRIQDGNMGKGCDCVVLLVWLCT